MTVSFALAGLSDMATEVVDAAGYAGLMVLMAVENVFPPIPSEIVLPLAGFQVALGVLTYAGALAAATTGSLVGALLLYAVGRIGGRPLLVRHGRLLRLSAAHLDRADGWFERHGSAVVLFGRLIPGVRSLVSIPAGVARMPLARFCALTALGSLAWNALLIAAGFALGANWDRVGTVVGPLSTAVLVAAVLGAAGVLVARRRTSG